MDGGEGRAPPAPQHLPFCQILLQSSLTEILALLRARSFPIRVQHPETRGCCSASGLRAGEKLSLDPMGQLRPWNCKPRYLCCNAGLAVSTLVWNTQVLFNTHVRDFQGICLDFPKRGGNHRTESLFKIDWRRKCL